MNKKFAILSFTGQGQYATRNIKQYFDTEEDAYVFINLNLPIGSYIITPVYIVVTENKPLPEPPKV